MVPKLCSKQVRWTLLLLVLALAGLHLYLASTDNLYLIKLNQLDIEVERRVKWWDWKDTAEETFCRAAHVPTNGTIPSVVHFILLADEGIRSELTYARFLAIKAVILRMDATEIKLHTYGLNTTNPWWRMIEKHVSRVEIDRSALHGPHGVAVETLQLAHQADILRLDILIREGGIYLDLDVYVLKPFTDLLGNPRDAIMGHEGGNRYGLCNAVVLARAGSSFLARWQESYKTFDPHVWNEHSVRKPKKLQVQYPESICALSPTVFFWPTWAKTHIRYMFDPISAEEANELRTNMTAFGGAMYENQLAYHASAHQDLPGLSAERIAAEDTRFNVLLRDVALAGMP